MEDCVCLCGLGFSEGCRCRQQCLGPAGPAETAAADSMPGPAPAPGQVPDPAAAEKHLEAAAAEKHLEAAAAEKDVEAAAAALCCEAVGGIASPVPPLCPPRCSLQDLPVEVLVKIFALLPVTDLPSLALACTKFHSILHIDNIWRQRCREEYGVCENFLNPEVTGMSCREVYTKLFHPYRNILGLWQLDTEPYRELLNVAVEGLGITGWKYLPPRNCDVDGPMELKPLFRIRLTERKSTTVDCMGDSARPHSCQIQLQKDAFTTNCNQTDQQYMCECTQKDIPDWLSAEPRMILLSEQVVEEHPTYPTYRRIYLPPSHPGDLIKPGLFKATFDAYSLKIAMLSFHGKYARATKVSGDPTIPAWKETLEIHLTRRIELPDGDILSDLNKLSLIVQEIDQQVIQEQQEEDMPEDSESPAQPSAGEFVAAALEQQPVHSFVLPVGVFSLERNYPGTYRMCFYCVDIVTSYGVGILTHQGITYPPRRFPGICILFDENHFGFLSVKPKCFVQYSRVHDTF